MKTVSKEKFDLIIRPMYEDGKVKTTMSFSHPWQQRFYIDGKLVGVIHIDDMTSKTTGWSLDESLLE